MGTTRQYLTRDRLLYLFPFPLNLDIKIKTLKSSPGTKILPLTSVVSVCLFGRNLSS